MGFQKNIAKKIQIGLNARLKAMSRYGDTSLVSGEILGPVSQADGDSVDKSNDFKLSREAVQVKSPYVRMLGVGDQTIDVITGMFNNSIDTKLKQNTLSGIQNLTGGPGALYNLEKGEDITTARFGNKEPGILGVACTFLDGGNKGGAARKATITWQCWTMEDLQRFQQMSFLSMGAGIIVDWGWARADSNSSAELEPPNFIVLDEAGKASLNTDLFTKEENEDGTRDADPWQIMPEEKYGDWDGIVGIVTAVNWAMNDSGGFDCTTDVLAKGSNVFSDELVSENKDEAAPTPMGNSETGLESGRFEEFVKETYRAAIEGGDFTEEEQSKIKEGFEADIINERQLNITQRLATLDIEIFEKYFSEAMTADYGEEDPGPQVMMSGDKGVAAIIYPEASTVIVDGWFGDSEEVRYGNKSLNEKDATNVKRNANFKTEIWLQWAWLEDNLVSYYAQGPKTDISPTFRSVEFKELDAASDPIGGDNEETQADRNPYTVGHQGTGLNSAGEEVLHTAGQRMGAPPQRDIIQKPPPEKPAKVAYQSVEIKNHPKLVTHTTDFLLPGQTPENWFVDKVGDVEKSKPNHYKKLANLINSSPNFYVNEKKESGYLRHIYVNLSLVRSVFSNPGISIDKAMLKLAERLNSKMKIWDFEIREIEETTVSLSNGSKVNIPPYYGIYTKTEAAEQVQSDDSKASKSYVFENYGLNSLIKTMDISTNISSTFASHMAIARSSGQLDPIQSLLGRKAPTQTQTEAEDMAKFFANQKVGNEAWSFITNTMKAKEMNQNIQYGTANPVRAEGSSFISNEIKETGLSDSKWDHAVSNFIKLQPKSGKGRLDTQRKRLEDALAQGSTSLDIDELTETDDYNEKAQELNMFAFPPDSLKLVVKDKSDIEIKQMEAKAPYNNSFNLNPMYFKTLKWYLSDNDITALLSSKNNDKVKQLPIEVSITIDGCGGIKIGNMFRLAYLPQDVYKQIGSQNDPDFTPGTYFIAMEVSHEINSEGWNTSIKGIMKGNFKVIADSKREAMLENGGIDEDKLKKAIEDSFESAFQKVTNNTGAATNTAAGGPANVDGQRDTQYGPQN